MSPAGPPPPLLHRAPLARALALGLWAAVLLQGSLDGRLDLLLRTAFHPLVTIAGVLLLGLALLQLAVGFGVGCRRDPLRREGPWERTGRSQGLTLLATAALALLVMAVPPAPSFADLASQRPRDETAVNELSFVLPPAQRTLTDWVRLLRSQPDPRLFDGDPVRISGFVLPVPGDTPQIARLLVRCCLADATPVGLTVRWPQQGPPPAADQWLSIEGTMAVGRQPGVAGGERLEVVPRRIRPIPRPARPLEP